MWTDYRGPAKILDRAAGHRDSLAVERQPDFAGTVDAAVLPVRPRYRGFENLVPYGSLRRWPAGRVVVGGGRDLAVVLGENSADRLDAPSGFVFVDEFHDHLDRRSSAAAKKLDAA